MRYWLLLMSLFLVLPAAVYAQDDEPAGDATDLANVRLVVDRGTHTGEVRTALFSSDGKRLFTFGNDRTIQLWNTETGRRERVLRLPADLTVPATFGSIAMGMALSPDDRVLAVSGGERVDKAGRPEHPVLLINLETGGFKTLLGAPGMFSSLVYSPDGKRLSGDRNGAKDRVVYVWDVAAGGPPRALRQHEGHVRAVAFSPTGLLASAGDDKMVCIWNLDRKKTADALVATLPHTAEVRNVAWAPDGKHLATVAAGTVHYWEADGKKPLRSFEPADLGPTCRDADSVTLSELHWGRRPDMLLVSWYARARGEGGVGGVSLIDVGTGKVTEGYKRQLGRAMRDVGAALSPDGKWGVLIYGDLIALWPTDAPQKRRLLGDSPPFPGDIGWGEDNRTIAWGGDVDAVDRESPLGPLTRALNLETLEIRSSKAALADVRNTSRKVPGWERHLRGGEVSVLHNGKKVYEKPANSNSMPTLVPRDGDGALLAMFHGKKIDLFDPLQDKVIQTLSAPPGHPFRMCASPDGKYLLVATRVQRLLIYSVKTAEQLLSLYVSGEDWVAWTKEGYYAASPGGERMMGWFVQEKPDELPRFHPAARFRKQLHRPEVIRLVLEIGSVKAAIEAAAKTVRAGAKGPAELGKLLPPQVKLEIIDRSKLPGEVNVRATADAGALEQPVASLCLNLDGKLAPVEKSTVTFTPAVRKGATAEWTVKLPAGNHRLAVFARSKDSSALSDEIEVNGPAPGLRGTAKLHICCIGVSQYANHGKGAENQNLNLQYAAKDAEEISGVLLKTCGAGRLFSPGTPTVLKNSGATTKAILAELEKLTKDTTVQSSDLAVIYFSCHGEKDDDGKLWLLTHEADRANLKSTCLSGEKLKEVLANMPCRVLLLLDACKSAAGNDPRRKASVTNDLTAMLTEEDCGVAVITAARGKEFALEGVKIQIDGKEQEVKNGLFTWALRQALEGKATADPYDGRIYTHDVYQHVFREVQHWSGGRQHPCLGIPWGSRPLPLVWRE